MYLDIVYISVHTAITHGCHFKVLRRATCTMSRSVYQLIKVSVKVIHPICTVANKLCEPELSPLIVREAFYNGEIENKLKRIDRIAWLQISEEQ